jgi:S-adenosylmethionine:tRNA ribosyltransferase-isomerase
MSEKGASSAGLGVADFDFDLPPELIAQQPPAQRGQSRMLVFDRASGAVRDVQFADFPSLLRPGDLLVLNDTRVIPARLYARRTLVRERERPSGQIEVLLTEPVAPPTLRAPSIPRFFEKKTAEWVGDHEPQPTGQNLWPGAPGLDSETRESDNLWRALVRPGRKVAIGERLVFPAPDGSVALEAEVLERGQFGERLLRFAPVDDFFAVLDRIGHIPLPPYIRRDDAAADRERYQTVFSRDRGSVAAPTAGLHFTPEILDELAAKGVEITRVTLHVGLGTFAPLRVDRLEEVRLHRERYTLPAEAAEALNRAAADGRRIVAVGTTVVRTLEHCAQQAKGCRLQGHSGETEIFISPGFQFRLVGALLTNFHLPQSSLLMLVSAFGGREPVLAAYRHAVEQKYRFFSYGDCMFVA